MAAYTFNQLISFTRTSAATYVNSAGNIVTTPASKNLLTFTEEFDNAAWGKSNATVTANSVAAPDGLMTADTITASAANGTFLQTFTASATPYTFSIWLRRLTGTGDVQLTVDGTTFVTVAVTSEWTRFSTTLTPSAGSRTAGVRLVTSSDAVYAWGAQLETGSTATSYTRNFGGLFPPRFDYDPVTLQPRGLLIEEQRTNLLLRSEEFDNAGWTKSGGSITANAATSPDGTADADLFTYDTANASHGVDQASTVTAAAQTFSVYIKPNGVQWVRLDPYGTASPGTDAVWFDIVNGVKGTQQANCTGTITPAGNGWYRLTWTATTTAAGITVSIRGASADNSSASFLGDGVSGFYLWGAQLEAGSFATSYIPTVASQVTRTADQASIVAPNFAPWYNQNEGTLVAEFSSFMPTAASQFAWTISNGTSDERWCLFMGSSTLRHFMADGGTTQASIDAGTYAANTVFKSAMAIKANSVQAAVNGALGTEDTAATLPTVDRLTFGASHSGATNFLNGHIRRITYYPSRLSNAQLQALSA